MKTVHHIAFNCRDRKAQEAFYSKLLGFRRARTFNKGKPDEFVMLRLGNTCMEFFQAPPAAKGRGGEQPVGYAHLAFEVANLEEAVALAKAGGVKPENIIDCSSSVPGLRICFFNDLEGNRVELMQGWKDE